MQGMIGVFGHVSVYQPERKTVLITPAWASNKGRLQAKDMVATDLDGKQRRGTEGPPVEWPIHTRCTAHAPTRSRGPLAHTLCDAVLHRQKRVQTG
jgi:ribulose-5-phosphate 4-epimerase/fuculose-1-phosphate aldolase